MSDLERKQQDMKARWGGKLRASEASQNFRRRGLCPTCGGDRAAGRTFCYSCIQKAKEFIAGLEEKRGDYRRKKLDIGLVYFIQSVEGGPIKIGFTKYAYVQKRLSEIQIGSPYPLRVIGVIEPGSTKLERTIHNQFQHLRLCGEWFKDDPELVEFINRKSTGKPEKHEN